MSNMSYCKFKNTNDDVIDCICSLVFRTISLVEEKEAALQMLYNILEFCIEEDIINNYNKERVKKVIEECK